MFSKQICYLCLRNHCEELPNFDGNLLAKKIKYCLPEIRGNWNSNVNKLICGKCNKTIEFIYKYKKMCLTNDAKSEHLFQQANSTSSLQNENGQMEKNNTENQKIEDNLKKDSSLSDNSENSETDNNLSTEIEIIAIDIDRCIIDASETENIDNETDTDTSSATNNNNSTQEDKMIDIVQNPENKKKFRCQTCDKLFSLHSYLIDHNLNSHNIYLCSFYECSETFTNESDSIEHKKNHIDFKECLICNNKFLTKDALFEHSETHMNHLQCTLCYKKFRNTKSLKWHQKYHPEYEFECPVCNEMFMYKILFQKHLQTHKNPEVFQCEICHKVLKYKQSLATHMKRHTDGCYKCNVCNETFEKRRELTAHEKMHKSKKILECPQCNKKLFSESGFRTHQKLVHSGKIYECLFCKKEFKLRASLLEHEWKCTNHSQMSLPTS